MPLTCPLLLLFVLKLENHLSQELRAPDNFLKQGVADVSLEAKGVFLQNAEVFSLPSFTPGAFYKLQILSRVKEKKLGTIAKSVT